MDTEKEPQREKSKPTKADNKFPYGWLFLGMGILLAGWLFVMYQGACNAQEPFIRWVSKPEALSALFTGLAFIAMFFALRIQSEELVLQREELALTREELHKTAEANAAMVKLTEKNLRIQFLTKWLKDNKTASFQIDPDEEEALGGLSVSYEVFENARKRRDLCNKYEQELHDLHGHTEPDYESF